MLPISDWMPMVVRMFDLGRRSVEVLFDEHEQMLPENLRRVNPAWPAWRDSEISEEVDLPSDTGGGAHGFPRRSCTQAGLRSHRPSSRVSGNRTLRAIACHLQRS